jgi:APA family basic amino acid/polyamine antiporter
MRKRAPDAKRTFRTPIAWFIGPAAALGCIYLFISLPSSTQLYFLIWNVIGLIVYLAYSRRTSLLARGVDAPAVREASAIVD